MENNPFKSPVEEEKKKRNLVLAIIFVVISIILFAFIAFTFGGFIKSTENKAVSGMKGQEQTDEDPIVSAPGIAVGEPNPNTPIPIESELTYTFPQAYGFEVTYTAANWTVVTEPTQVTSYDATTETFNNNTLRLTSTVNPNVNLDFTFRKAVSGMLNGNPNSFCKIDYIILKEQSSTAAQDGLIRIRLGSGEELYATSYFPGSNPSEMCVFTSHPIYKVEKVEGGENPNVPDTNDIYWIVNVTISGGNSQNADIDNIVKTIVFKEN